jgi:hypothetical protein
MFSGDRTLIAENYIRVFGFSSPRNPPPENSSFKIFRQSIFQLKINQKENIFSLNQAKISPKNLYKDFFGE